MSKPYQIEKMALLTRSELIKFAALPADFPTCEVSRIRIVEKTIFRECIGNELYDRLKADEAIYTSEEYESKTYEQGETAAYDGIIRIAKVQTNQVASGTDWEDAPKFLTACLNDLWCDALGEFISYAVLEINAPLLLSQIKHGTIIKVIGQNFEAGSRHDLNNVVKSLKQFKDLAFQNLIAYVEDNNKNGCYDGFKHCKPCQAKEKRGGWAAY